MYNVVDAKIRLCYLSGDNNQKLTVFGVKNNNWNESEISGATVQSFPLLRDGYGRGRLKTINIAGSNLPVYLNVRNWILGEVNTSTVSFRIISENASLNASYWASKENTEVSLRPALVLTFKKDEKTALSDNHQFPDAGLRIRDGHVSVNCNEKPFLCEIFTLSGQIAYSQGIMRNSTVSVPLEKGMYIVRLSSKEVLITKKIQIL
ncbi:hypothetical protein SDC9_110159 [bioreactor metagenome]|uniref:Secretion system C-terminal sorting domain-containing protein n=1 Tax=bioreactor metagenome TaxID=1076179 RepID=A0A645BCR7_9ZZZZ